MVFQRGMKRLPGERTRCMNSRWKLAVRKSTLLWVDRDSHSAPRYEQVPYIRVQVLTNRLYNPCVVGGLGLSPAAVLVPNTLSYLPEIRFQSTEMNDLEERYCWKKEQSGSGGIYRGRCVLSLSRSRSGGVVFR